MHCDVIGFAADRDEHERWRQFEAAIPGVVLLGVFDRCRGGRRAAGRVLRALKGKPVSMAAFAGSRVHTWLRANVRVDAYDIVHFDSFNLAEYRADVDAVPCVLVPHDAYSLAARQGSTVAIDLRDKLAFRLKARMYERFERTQYRRFDVVAPVAQRDAQWLMHLDSHMNVRPLRYPLGAEYVPIEPGMPREVRRIAVSGSFANPAICAGLVEFLQEVYPRLECLPHLQVVVWGRIPPKSRAHALMRHLPRILYVGHVEDYLGFLRTFDVFAYPQRYGAGVQTKVQQAMAVGIPVVARPSVLSSLGAHHRVHAFAHEENSGFAESILALVNDAYLRSRVGNEASALIHRRSSPQAVWESLSSVYQSALARPHP
jgi:glycosyltransferase involved in cell wall biosynthesis